MATELKERGTNPGLGNADAIATCAVKNIDTARRFYEGILGLVPLPSEESVGLPYKSGKSNLLVYQSEYAGTNQATAVTWAVRDLEAAVEALKAKGVRFE